MHPLHRLLAIALLLPGLAHANDLMRIYELATANDTTIQAARHARDAAVEAKPQARAALLPQLSSGYNYGYAKTTGSFEQGGTTFPIDNKGNDETLTVTVNQAIVNVASWRRLQQAGEQVALAQATYRSAEQALLLRVAEAYFGLLGASDNLRSAQAEKAAVERQLEQAKKRFEVGLSAITDVQEAQARYDLTVAQEIQAQQQLDSAILALGQITGTPVPPLAPLAQDIPLPSPDPADANRWVGDALDGNLDLLIASLNRNIAERGIQVARAGHLPTVGVQGAYRDSTSESGSFPQETESSSVTLGVTLPLFAGGATQSAVRQSIATRDQRTAELEGARRQVERSTRDAYQGVVTGAARVRAFKQAVVSSTTALEASETGLEVGTRTAVDVLNAQQQLYAARRNYDQSRYDYLLSVLRLKAAAGSLAPSDLAELDRLLVGS
ncbi:TolC family outer membrane protein [Fontimonas sp. SYSU GA230001]|uniref:TolC family outer membrane protein n=1 Tax=Fontimonas sp. SYSU GA230001 TaxID=3142450 RepID=UPI0032B4C6C7